MLETFGTEIALSLFSRARDAAAEAYRRYSIIALERGVFVRSSSSPRVQQSATEWREGAFESVSIDCYATANLNSISMAVFSRLPECLPYAPDQRAASYI